MTLKWRPMLSPDLPEIIRIASHVHADFPERMEIFEEKLNLYPQGSLVLDGKEGIKGYLFAHPWLYKQIPPLDTFLQALPADPDSFYIHDLALLPDIQGSGQARILVSHLNDHAREKQFHYMSLVAVNNSSPFWQKVGFHKLQEPELHDKLLSYGSEALYMVKDLSSDF
jgi:N-acetylglutamate synthase and related acetyltransferases